MAPVYRERAELELQAGILPWREFPRLASEGIAGGQDGIALRAIAPLIGEGSDRIRRAAESIPGIELRLIDELGLPRRTPREARWALAQLIARQIVDGDLQPERGAGELLSYVREDPDLLAATGGLEAIDELWDETADARLRSAKIVAEAQRIANFNPLL
jgi:hypothetical protein